MVRHADAYRWARSFEPADREPVVVFLDPPYREYEIHARHLNRMLAGLVEKLPPGSAIVLESGRRLDDLIMSDVDAWDIRRYGGTQVALLVIPEPEAGVEAVGESAQLEWPDRPASEEAGDE